MPDVEEAMFPYYTIFPLVLGFLVYLLLIDMDRNPEKYVELNLSYQFRMACSIIAMAMMFLGIAPLAVWYAR